MTKDAGVKLERAVAVTMLPRAECDDCNWASNESSTTRDRAKFHARTNLGHVVIVVVEQRSMWRAV